MLFRSDWDQAYNEGRDYTLINVFFLKKLLKDLNINEGFKILDYGCGTGDMSRKLADIGMNVMATDFSEEAIKIAKEKSLDEKYLSSIEYKVWGTNQIEGKYDMIILKLVLAFIPDKFKFLEKLKTYLNQNGKIIVITPVTYRDEESVSKDRAIGIEREVFIEKATPIFKNVESYHVDYLSNYSQTETFVCE